MDERMEMTVDEGEGELMPEQMSETEIRQLCEQSRQNGYGAAGSTVSGERAAAIRYFNREPYGDEEADRSSYITSETYDVVSNAVAVAMQQFTESAETVQFLATSEDDEERVSDESDYVKHVFWEQNDGFLSLQEFCYDAGTCRTGIFCVEWDDDKKYGPPRYLQGLNDAQFAVLSSDPAVEISGLEQRTIAVETPQGLVGATVYDVEVRDVTDKSKTSVRAVPPEHFTFDPDDPESFQSEDVRLTDSDLLQMRTELYPEGIPAEVVDHLPIWDRVTDSEVEEARDDNEDMAEMPYAKGNKPHRVKRSYIRADRNGDGIAETIYCCWCGNEVLDLREVDRMPYVIGAMLIDPHKASGLSYADLVMDDQYASSMLARHGLDNVWQGVNAETYYLENKADADDMLSRVIGKKTPVSGVQDVRQAVMSMPVQDLSAPVFAWQANIRDGIEQRTGIGPKTVGLDMDLLSNPKGDSGLDRVMSAGEIKTGLMVRNVASALGRCYLLIHATERENRQGETAFKTGNQWRALVPAEFSERSALDVNIGTGAGDKRKKAAALSMVNADQAQLFQMGSTLVDERRGYKALADKYRLQGLDPDDYLLNPDSPEYQQAQQQKAQQAQQAEAKQKAMLDQQERMLDKQLALQAQANEIQRYKAETDREYKQASVENEALKDAEKTETDRTKLELDTGRNVPGSAV